MTVSRSEDHREPVMRGKSPCNTAAVILHERMRDGGDLVRQYAARTLCMAAADAAVCWYKEFRVQRQPGQVVTLRRFAWLLRMPRSGGYIGSGSEGSGKGGRCAG